jgi:hypothetical protein
LIEGKKMPAPDLSRGRYQENNLSHIIHKNVKELLQSKSSNKQLNFE